MTKRTLGVVLLSAGLIACGGSDPSGPDPDPEPTPEPSTISVVSGGDQTATVATAVPDRLVVRVVNENGQGVSGVTVNWQVVSGGGSLPSSSVTNSAGQASATWTLGTPAGGNTATASVPGVGSVEFRAEAIAFYTVLVYLAADNNLSVAGVVDIEEMESIGSSDSVNIIVQGEFSPVYLGMAGCATAACINLNSYQTFRYRANSDGSVIGPNGPVTYIGNRDMTDPAELAEFVNWAKTEYPAERYALFLWNHGGGYQGLIEDQSSSPQNLMSLPQLTTALQSMDGGIDVLDFDMCLMGGIETLLSVDGYVDHVVFSQENEPGDGNPYHTILGDLRANPRMAPEDLSAVIVDRYDEFYRGGQSSITKSAINLSHFSGLRDAWRALGTELNANLDSYTNTLAAVIPPTQNYSVSFMRDLGDFLTRLEAAGPNQVLVDRIDAVQEAMGNGVITRNRFYTGSGYYAEDMSGSTGFHVVLPSGEAEDAFPSQGPLSLSAYQSAFGDEPWTSFLMNWTAAAAVRDYYDQGSNPLAAAILWNQDAFDAGVDFDFWVIEPNGDLYIPYLGVITPNGSFDGDSENTGNPFEIYATRRYIERGTYYFIGELYEAAGHAPELAFLYTTDAGLNWTDMYAESGSPYPAFSKQSPWASDPTPTFEEAFAGSYTDLKLVATWDVGTTSAANHASLTDGAVVSMRPIMREQSEPPHLTPAQTGALHQLLSDPAVQRLRQERRAAQGLRPAPERQSLRAWISGHDLFGGEQ